MARRLWALLRLCCPVLHHPLRQSLGFWGNARRTLAAELGLQNAAQRVDVRRERAKKASLAVCHHQQSGEVVHFHRVYQVGLVFDIDPDKLRWGKLGLQLLEQRPVIAAGAAPLGTQAGDQQAGWGGRVGRIRVRHAAMMAEVCAPKADARHGVAKFYTSGLAATAFSNPLKALMSAFLEETVLSVHHWTDRLFSFTTTRDTTLRFSNGHFTMIGLRGEGGKPLLRAYSIASANYEEHLEFLSIKVPNGPLTSKLQHIQVGDKIVVGRKPTGTLLIDCLLKGKILYLIGTGTGVAPFLSIVRDPATYEQFEKVVLVHGVRQVAELAYYDYLSKELPEHEFLGEMVRAQLLYYPTVTREPFKNQGRITDLLATGKLQADLGLPKFDPATDRVMLCGSPEMLRDLKKMLEERGFAEGNTTKQGDYVIERAFVEQ
jgi:ferredoxin--NADP+ reductase